MIWINLREKLPTDTDIHGWKPWTKEEWDAWLKKSKDLVAELARLQAAGKTKERNDYIDANSGHWTKLKEWLLALSHGKCWFSEVKELFSHYDVEHFRPKKVAKGLDKTERDGYWWLAFDYMNFRACGGVGNTKKGGWFPLRGGSDCSTYADQREDCEFPYLLDPIDADDVSLLAFDEKGDAIPVPGCSDWDRTRVEETVKRLKLNEHDFLAEARRKRWQKVDKLVDNYRFESARNAKAPNPAAKEKLRQICKQLRELSDPKEELSAVTKWCVIVRDDPVLRKLVA